MVLRIHHGIMARCSIAIVNVVMCAIIFFAYRGRYGHGYGHGNHRDNLKSILGSDWSTQLVDQVPLVQHTRLDQKARATMY
jgi:hypothetical protein